jgi:hypothetical protein
MAMEHRWNKCISLNEDYVKKYKQFWFYKFVLSLLGWELSRVPSYYVRQLELDLMMFF